MYERFVVQYSTYLKTTAVTVFIKWRTNQTAFYIIAHIIVPINVIRLEFIALKPMFNDIYNYVPQEWKFYIDERSLAPVIEKLNRHQFNDVLPEKDRIFEPLSLIKPNDVRVVILASPSPQNELSSGIPYGIPFEYRFTDIAKRIPEPPIRKNVIDYIYSLLDGERDNTLKDAVSRGILLLNYPLTCSPKRKNAHINYDWSTIVKRIIERLLFRDNSSLLLIAWNEEAYNLYTNVITNWLPSMDNMVYTSPVYRNMRMIVATGPDKNISNNRSKYSLISSSIPFDNPVHKEIIKRALSD